MLRMDQWSRALEVFVRDGIRRPISERAERSGWVVPVLLRKDGGAHDKKIIGVPSLQITIDDARFRICAHHRSASVMGRLIRHNGEVARSQTHVVVGWIHPLNDA